MAIPAVLSQPTILRRARSFADLHFHQKWRIVWPELARLPQRDVNVLDAGCGEGAWSLEIAARRADWSITGIDRDSKVIERAQLRRDTLRLANVSFRLGDFVEFRPARPVDLVLSICSTHYGPSNEDTVLLFRRMASWLKPGGSLVLLAPRCDGERPFVSVLARPRWHGMFSRSTLTALCQANGLTIDRLVGRIGRVGTMAKQLDWWRRDLSLPSGLVVKALARGLATVDAHLPAPQTCTLMWLLVARRQP